MASYTVKEWFANKVANEVRRNITMCNVFCILRETEKAVYAVLDLGANFSKTMWVPKSVLVEFPVGTDDNGIYHRETLYISDYNEAISRFKAMWSDFT